MYNSLPLLFHGTIVGFILFQTILLTPVVFNVLNPSAVSVLLRAIFPRFFISIFFISFFVFAFLFYKTGGHSVTIVNVFTIFLSGLCYFLIPYTNRARDVGNNGLFSVYHNISVISTLLMLILNISVFFWLNRPLEQWWIHSNVFLLALITR